MPMISKGTVSAMNELLVVLTIFLVTSEGISSFETCERQWTKVGCFHDRVFPDRPLNHQLLNRRDIYSHVFDNKLIDWSKYEESIHALACRCAEIAKEKSYDFFGLQFYGECWGGVTDFKRDGTSEKCIGADLKPCTDSMATECIGKAFTNYIYALNESATKTPVDGSWGMWSPWEPCTKSCGGGITYRERACDSPAPTTHGKDCVGHYEEEKACNDEACVEVCPNKAEFGIILDGSNSLTGYDWNKAKEFVHNIHSDFIEGNVHFGIIQYGIIARVEFEISNSAYWGSANFTHKLDEITKIGGTTETHKALELAKNNFFCKNCGLRVGVPRLLLVVTDGMSNQPLQVISEFSRAIEAEKVTILAVGVGDETNEAELSNIASHKTNVFNVHSYNHFVDKINAILRRSCDEIHPKSHAV